MLDPTIHMGAAPQAVAAAATPPGKPQVLDPAETRTFASMMQERSSVATRQAERASDTSPLQRAVLTQGVEFSQSFDALDRSRESLVSASGLGDPMMTMWRAVDFSFQSTTLFTRLHIASGLATSVTNSFSSLLKSQQ